MKHYFAPPRSQFNPVWFVIACVVTLLFSVAIAQAGPVNEPITVSWDNPTLRANGESIVGGVTVTLHWSKEAGGDDVQITAAPAANSATFVPRDEGLTVGDWYAYATAVEAGNSAGPSGPSNTLDPLALAPIPDSPPAAPVMIRITVGTP